MPNRFLPHLLRGIPIVQEKREKHENGSGTTKGAVGTGPVRSRRGARAGGQRSGSIEQRAISTNWALTSKWTTKTGHIERDR